MSVPSVCALGFALGLTLVNFATSASELSGGQGSQDDFVLATEYLQHYYNFSTASSGRWRRSEPALTDKLRDMQHFFGLNVTGALDSETLKVMKTPRCGVPDVQEYSDSQGSRWSKNALSYSIGRYTADLPRPSVDSLIQSALNVWAQASPLTFTRSSTGHADIMVDFSRRDHGDAYPFDGPRGTLAHAFGPGEGVGGDTHFDDDEEWTTGGRGFNLYLVAAHEFGHSLGLKHSSNPSSLMYPTYKSRSQSNLLAAEDISNINSLYRTQTPTYQHPSQGWSHYYYPWFLGPRFPMRMGDKCNLTLDASTVLRDTALLFKDSYAWVKRNRQPDIDEPMTPVGQNIDAAYIVPKTSTLYLFKGSKYWTIRRSQVRSRAKSIYKFGFPKWVSRLDAALHLNGTENTLFFRKQFYWRYNENNQSMADSRLISKDFPGINTRINAAVSSNGFMLFFCGPKVLKYDYSQKKVVETTKVKSWLGC